MSEYTKGKWDWSEKEDITHGCSITVNGAVIATVDGTDEEMQANARLIVAAPALLDACKESQKRLTFLQKKIVEAKLIIMDGIEIRKTASCISFVEAAIAQAKE